MIPLASSGDWACAFAFVGFLLFLLVYDIGMNVLRVWAATKGVQFKEDKNEEQDK